VLGSVAVLLALLVADPVGTLVLVGRLRDARGKAGLMPW
jgi:hypothetical protein